MTVLICPTFSDPRWTQSSTFEGTKYQLQFTYNQRAACWYMDLADADGVDIYNGVKLTVGPLLLKKCKDPRRPPGDFVVTSNTIVTTPPTLLELLPGSGRCTLGYITSDWLAVIKSGNAAAIAGLYAQIAAGGVATNPVSTYGQG